MSSFNIDNFKIDYYYQKKDDDVGWAEQFYVEEIYHCGEPIFSFLLDKLGMDTGNMDKICFEIFKEKNND